MVMGNQAVVGLNISSMVYGNVTLTEQAQIIIEAESDVTKHSAGLDTHISALAVHSIDVPFDYVFKSSVSMISMWPLIGNTARTATFVIYKIDGAAAVLTGAVVNAKLTGISARMEHDVVTAYVAHFIANSTDGSTNPATFS
jgi:hypothetical protein